MAKVGTETYGATATLTKPPEASTVYDMAALASPGPAPDPVLTANIYCAGRLDELVLGPLRDFRTSLRQEFGLDALLWFVRYRKCGEHIKVRLHAPHEYQDWLRQHLADTFQPFLAGAVTTPSQGRAQSPRGLPAIDPEDRHGEDYPDCSLLFTTYERSYVSLGGSPWLENDAYVALLTRWLASSADLVLDELKLDSTLQVPHRSRQSLLIKVVLSTLAGLDIPNDLRAEYLRYHRDWLLRFILLKSVSLGDKTKVPLERFNQQIAGMGAMTGAIARTIDMLWNKGPSEGHPLRTLADFLEPSRGQEETQVDPFTPEPAFPAVFKGLHGSANQIGLSMLNEAFAYHLLLSVASPGKASESVKLLPE